MFAVAFLVLLARTGAVSLRSLLYNQSSTAHPWSSEKDVAYHVHIPKAAGTSFLLNSFDVLKKHGLRVVSEEGCFSGHASDPRVFGNMVMLRDPRRHVVSMYDFCNDNVIQMFRLDNQPQGAAPIPGTFGEWVHAWRQQMPTWQGNFTPSTMPGGGTGLVQQLWSMPFKAMLDWRMSTWSAPPYYPEVRQPKLSEKDWPTACGGGTIWHSVNVPYQCYVPLNFQTQRFSCQNAMEWSSPPDLEGALANMRSSFFIGILEHYQASVCLLELKLGGPLPKYCDCRDPKRWATFPEANVLDFGHKTHLESQADDVMRELDEITSLDRQLYEEAQVRFKREVAEVEASFGTRLLCD